MYKVKRLATGLHLEWSAQVMEEMAVQSEH